MESGTELAGRYHLETPLGPGGACEAWRSARRMEAFVLCEDGGVWHSRLRLAQEAVLDWSTWARLPLSPGRVTAIAACQFDQREGAVVAATSDGGLHCATYGIEVAGTGLSRWSRWARVPAA